MANKLTFSAEQIADAERAIAGLHPALVNLVVARLHPQWIPVGCLRSWRVISSGSETVLITCLLTPDDAEGV